MKVSVIIPVYNEKNTFEAALKKVLEVPLTIDREVIIIEGGSTDGTRELVKKYDKKKNIKTFYLTGYSGKGYKVKYGMKKATGDIILIQDADLEYNPNEYPELLAPIIEGKTQFVLGSRHLGKKTWKIRQFDYSKWYGSLVNIGSEAFNYLFWFMYGIRLTDPQTMYKIFTKESVKDMTFRSNNFQLDWEIVIKLVKAGHIPAEVPVTYQARTVEEGKKIRLWRDGILAAWAILRFRFWD